MQTPSFCLLGVGNILEKDDGFAVYAAAYLERNYTFEPPVDIVNGGVEGINLLNLFMAYRQILILDAVGIDDAPGSIYHIPSSALTGYGLNSGGAHEIGVLQCIDMLELMGRPLPASAVLGIVPKTVGLRIGLTTLMKKRFPAYIETVIGILEKEHVTVEKKAGGASLEEIIDAFQNPTSPQNPR